MNINSQDAEKIVQQLEAHALGPDDTFAFACDRCGRCCRHREDILLNPGDLYRIARYLDMTPAEAIARYCEVYEGPDSHLPVVRLKPKQYRHTCPFLGREGCTIHAAKPTVCALFPLGRAYIPHKDELLYFCQPLTCGSDQQTHTVREWLAEFGLEYADEDTLAWMRLTPRLTIWMQRIGSKLRESTRQKAILLMIELCYLHYDIHKPFTEQFSKNREALIDALSDA